MLVQQLLAYRRLLLRYTSCCLNDGTQLNLSPLRGLKGVKFVINGKQLGVFLNKVYASKNLNKRKKYFFINKQLPKWKKLIVNNYDEKKNINNILNNSLSEIFQGRKVLVTGHTGFKGSWLAIWLNLIGAKVLVFQKVFHRTK